MPVNDGSTTIDFENFLGKDEEVIPATKNDDKDNLDLTDLPDDEDPDDRPEPEDEKDEDTEEKPELKIDEEDDLDINIPNRAKILKDFPDLFKKHPSIEKAIYREQQYAEVFPHPKDAEDAKNSVNVLASIEAELGRGDIKNLLVSVKKFDEKAFEQITESFLPTLKEINQPAYLKTVNHVLKMALHQANEFGSSTADKDSDQYQIGLAARILNKWIYNSDKTEQPEELAAKKSSKDPKEVELEERDKKYHESRMNGAVQEVDDRIVSVLTRNIDSAIDPKNLMTPYVKTKAVKDVIDQFKTDVRKDKRLNAGLERLWKACREDDYSDKSKMKIKDFIKGHAKQVLPDIIRRVKAEALKDYKKVSTKSERRDERPLERRRPSADNNSPLKKDAKGKFQLPAGKTATEFLLED